MFISELSEPQLLVIYPGRFQPFHKGHHAVYEWLSNKFGRNTVYIATSNKTDAIKSPFTFAEKSYFMQLTGVPGDRIVQATSPYNIESVLSGGVTVNNRQNTVVIFAVSEKDMAEDPRFASWSKKDGSPAYFQPLKDIKQTRSMDEHGYILTVPTFDFAVLGHPMRSGTELRKLYSESDEAQRREIIKDLFGKYTIEAEQIMNNKIAAPVNEDRSVLKRQIANIDPNGVYVIDEVGMILAGPIDSRQEAMGEFRKLLAQGQDVELIQGRALIMKLYHLEECGGVGVVKGGNDPRYSTATMGNQNAVNGGTLGKEMKAFGLVGRKSPGAGKQQAKVSNAIGTGTKK